MPKYTEDLQKLVKVANQVLAIYPTFLGEWVFAVFHEQMNAHVLASKSLGYDYLITHDDVPLNNNEQLPEEWLKKQTDVSEALVTSDSLLKRVRKAVQVTWDGMHREDPDNEFNGKIKALLTGMNNVQDAIVETMKVDSIRARRDPPLPDDYIPDEQRNMKAGDERNLRDWIFLRESRAVLEYIVQLFGNFIVENK